MVLIFAFLPKSLADLGEEERGPFYQSFAVLKKGEGSFIFFNEILYQGRWPCENTSGGFT